MREFFDAVVKMREAQKRYFRVRSATALTEVDRIIREQQAAVEYPLLTKGFQKP